MSRQRILSKLRKQAWFKPTMVLLDELGIDFEIVPPTGRGHPMLKFEAAGGQHRVPLPGSPSGGSEAEHYIANEIKRRVRGHTR